VAHPQVAAFARLANGQAQATRKIAGQNTLFTRTIHDMAYDSVRDEIIVPSLYASAILFFKGDANGNVAPVRKIYGPKSTLARTETLAVDGVHGEVFVPQTSALGRLPRIVVFPTAGDGDVAPLRVLEGPDTGLLRSIGRVTVDPVHNLLFVSGGGGIRIFDRTASGNTKPLRFIRTSEGSNSRDATTGSANLMTTNPGSGMIFAAIRGGTNSEEEISGRFGLDDYVGVWSIYDDGDVPPRFTIGGPNLLLKDVRGVAVDPKSQSVMISDKTFNGIMTFHVPEVFVAEAAR
jgi:hypothetical protein